MKIKDETAYINAVKEKQKLEKTAVGKRLAKLNTLLSEYDIKVGQVILKALFNIVKHLITKI